VAVNPDALADANNFMAENINILLATPKWAQALWHVPTQQLTAGAEGESLLDPYERERMWLGISIMMIWVLWMLQGYFTLISWSYYRRWFRSVD
jgi:hypothetical protein